MKSWITLAVLAMVGLALIIGAGMKIEGAALALWQPLLAVIAILIVLGMFVVVLGLLNLSSHPFALGLPSGSVRAILALSLVFIFTGASLMMLSSTDLDSERAEITQFAKLSEQDVAALRNSLTDALVIVTLRETVGAATVYSGSVFESEPSTARVDIAKQILTALITALSVVTGFYFGSRSVSSAEANRDTAVQVMEGDKRKQGELFADIIRGRSQRVHSSVAKLKEVAASIVDDGLRALVDTELSNAESTLERSAVLEKRGKAAETKLMAAIDDSEGKHLDQAKAAELANTIAENIDELQAVANELELVDSRARALLARIAELAKAQPAGPVASASPDEPEG